MRTNTIDYSKIKKRKIALESCVNETKDNRYLYNITKGSFAKNNSTIINDTEKFLEGCRDIYNANKYYKNCLSLLESAEKMDNNQLSEMIIFIFAEQVIPYIDNLDNLKSSIDKYELTKESSDKLLEEIKEYKICDRVINNTKSIKKQFNLEKIVEEKRYFPLFESVFDCCSLIDTYAMPSYGKMNIALEQMSYLLQKNAIDYNKKDLANYISEYFLLTNEDLSAKDLKKYKSVLEENLFLEDEDITDTPLTTNTKNPILDLIARYKLSEDKTSESLWKLADDIFTNNIEQILDNFYYILSLLRNLLLLSVVDADVISNVLSTMMDKLLDFETNLDKRQLNMILIPIKAEYETLNKICVRSNDKLICDNVDIFTNKLYDIISKIDNIISGVYSNEKIEDDIKYESFKESVEPVYLNEFKIFKFQNLISATIAIDKFLNRKGMKFGDFIKKKAKKVFTKAHKFFTESGELDKSIFTSDGTIDICIEVYELLDYKDSIEMHEIMEGLCESLNKTMNIPETSRITYRNIDNRFELHLEDATCILDPDTGVIEGTLSEYDMMNCAFIKETADNMEAMFNMITDEDGYCFNFVKNIIPDDVAVDTSADLLSSTLEALQYTGLCDKKDIKNIVSLYSEANYNDYVGNTKLNSVYNNWISYDAPLDVQIESMKLAQDIINEKFDLNKIKLAMGGIKKKVRQLGAKEQEATRNMDAAANHFMNAAKQAMTNDRREAIIKGSVIPSFSKCIKIAIGIAGIFRFVDPTLAIITAFVGLAVSKNLNRKERSLLLDEIDIELKVLDKEIANVENSNNTKKYRELIIYQKKLQREKQRIKYNIKVGGDLPDSDMGTAYSKN